MLINPIKLKTSIPIAGPLPYTVNVQTLKRIAIMMEPNTIPRQIRYKAAGRSGNEL